MLDAWNRAQHYRDLAERRLAMTSFSTQMRTSIRRWQYGVLAEAELILLSHLGESVGRI